MCNSSEKIRFFWILKFLKFYFNSSLFIVGPCHKLDKYQALVYEFF